MRAAFVAAACAALLLPAAVAAQASVTAGGEILSEERRRGLSWSAGRAAVGADVSAEAAGLRGSARVAATRGSPRHGGADAVADLDLSARRRLGPVDVELRARAHLFAGARGRQDYVETGAAAFYTLGPLTLDAGIDFAPSQAAIGGSNLYLSAGAAAGVPGTPFTLVAGAGRSSGDVDDPVRAARLRPAGRYHDWRLGVEHVRGRLTLSVDYVGTDVDRDAALSPFADARHSGDALLARARMRF